MKKCPSCHKTKKITSFNIERKAKDGHCCYCRECKKISTNIYNKTYKEIRKRKCKELKLQVLSHYGNECNNLKCNEKRWYCLTIDHKDDDGAKFRSGRKKGKSGGGYGLYRWIINNNYPDNLQVLCWNCNCVKGFYGFLPS
jgi:hypothetical protein